MIQHLCRWMRNYAKEEGKDGFVVGISGGVDSAVASAIAARTGLPVICLELPLHQSIKESERAHDHCLALAKRYPLVEHYLMDLTELHDAYIAKMDPERMEHHGAKKEKLELADVNTKIRLRLVAQYYCATARNLLVVGTGNRVEKRGVGFFAKYGDGGMDLAPLGKLYKSEVYALAMALKIDQRIIDAAPTDGLWADGRTTLDQMGATYLELEWAMDLREGGADTDVMKLDQRQRAVLEIYDQRHKDIRHIQRSNTPEGPIPRSLL